MRRLALGLAGSMAYHPPLPFLNSRRSWKMTPASMKEQGYSPLSQDDDSDGKEEVDAGEHQMRLPRPTRRKRWLGNHLIYGSTWALAIL